MDSENFKLPVIPTIAMKIIEFSEDNISLNYTDFVNIIKNDSAIVSKILKLGNSSLYARQYSVNNLEKAISLLGFKTVKNLVLILSATSAFNLDSKNKFFTYYWKNSVLTAYIAKDISLMFLQKSISEEVFLSGIIHKIGQMALYYHSPSYWEHYNENRMGLKEEEFELQYYKITHRELGAEMLKQWSFPNVMIDCVKYYGLEYVVSKFKKEIDIISIADKVADEIINKKDLNKDDYLDVWFSDLNITYDEFILLKEKIVQRVMNNKEISEIISIYL